MRRRPIPLRRRSTALSSPAQPTPTATARPARVTPMHRALCSTPAEPQHRAQTASGCRQPLEAPESAVGVEWEALGWRPKASIKKRRAAELDVASSSSILRVPAPHPEDLRQDSSKRSNLWASKRVFSTCARLTTNLTAN